MGRQSQTFGQLLRGFRLSAGLTQRELAERAGVSVRALRDIEQGRVQHPRAPSVQRFADALALAGRDRRALLISAGGAAPAAGTGGDAPARPQVAVLGPLAVRRDGTTVEVESHRLRHLLGLLAIQPDRTVSVREIIDVLWPASAPATARRLVHSYAGKLRAILQSGPDPPAGDVLAATRAGFRLALDAGHLDLVRFDELAGQAQRALDAGDRAGAHQVSGEALACWRGPVLADADPRLRLHPAAVAVAQRRLAVSLSFADLAIELGQHEQALVAVRAVAGDEPLHEGVNARLMLALAGCGQQAAALAVFRDLRTRLVKELGIEPGPQLQEAHLRVLRHDLPGRAAETDPPPADPDAPQEHRELAVPAHLPADVPGFAGRTAQLKQLDGLLPEPGDAARAGTRTAPTIAVIAGTAGVGKTALAVHWAHRLRDRFPDGQLYVNLRGYASAPPLRPVQALAGFLRALGVPAEEIPGDPAEAAGLYRSLLADKRLLVLLDNARDPAQVRALLPASAGCLVLITSRDRLAGLAAREGARRLRLDVLTEAEAGDLLVSVLDDRARTEPAALAELAQACARLPLALRVAAANLAHQPEQQTIAGYVAELRAGNRLSALESDDDEQAAVRGAFDLSYATLAPEERVLFRRLGLAPGPDVTAEAAAALVGGLRADAARLLDRLAAGHLIDQCAPGRYAFHDLLRLYATERVQQDGAAERAAALDRLHQWYLNTVDTAARLLYPEKSRLALPTGDGPAALAFADHAAALAWLEAERPNLLAVIQDAAEHGSRPVAWLLADALRGYFFLRLNTVDWEAAAQAGLAAAATAGDLSGQSSAHLSLASIRRCEGRYRPAVDEYAQALTLAREAGWLDGESTVVGNLATVYWQLGRLPEAAEHFAQAIALCEQTGWLAGQATALGNLGALHIQLGQLDRAGEGYRRALALVRQIGSRPGEAINLANLGEVYHALGRLDLARTHLDQALDLQREAGGRGAEAEALRILAEVDLDAGHEAVARERARAALLLARDNGDRQTEAGVLATLGGIEDRAGRYRQAVLRHDEALRLAREIEGAYPEVVALVGAAQALAHAGDARGAQARAELALRLARERRYRVLEGHAASALAAARLGLGRVGQAVDEAGQALAILTEAGHRLGVARAHQLLAAALERAGDAAGATPHRRAAAAVFAEVGAGSGGAVTAGRTGSASAGPRRRR
ncbi:MAG: hypothetical protein V7603_5217 [Micromonosporaceae bacterium]